MLWELRTRSVTIILFAAAYLSVCFLFMRIFPALNIATMPLLRLSGTNGSRPPQADSLVSILGWCHGEAAFVAGKAFLAYRRRGGLKTAPLPDFYIGAHAAVQGMKILTRDPKRYVSYFPAVKIIEP
jgi:hypothetical protein